MKCPARSLRPFSGDGICIGSNSISGESRAIDKQQKHRDVEFFVNDSSASVSLKGFGFSGSIRSD